MKIFKVTLIVLVTLILLVFSGSFFLDGRVQIERSVTVKASPFKVYQMLTKVVEWKKWNPWFQSDTNLVWTAQGNPGTSGYEYHWKSEQEEIGEGSLVFKSYYPDTLLIAETTFGKLGVSLMEFQLQPEGESTKLNWKLSSSVENVPMVIRPLAKYFFLFLDGMVGPDFEKGLEALRVLAEADPTLYIGGYEAEYKDFPATDYFGIREKVADTLVGNWLSSTFSLLQKRIHTSNLVTKGVPFTIHYGIHDHVLDIEAGTAVMSNNMDSTRHTVSKLPAQRALVVKCKGSYQILPDAYRQTFDFLNRSGKKLTGPPMEYYYTDPVMEPDTSKWYTEIVFPVGY